MNDSWLDVDACTLPTTERPLRAAEFDALFAEHVTVVERVNVKEVRLILDGGRDLAGRVRDLADRESDCCAFFSFTVAERTAAEGTESVELSIAVPGEHVDILEAIAASAEAYASTATS